MSGKLIFPTSVGGYYMTVKPFSLATDLMFCGADDSLSKKSRTLMISTTGVT